MARTTPRQFRLSEATLEELDRIAAHIEAETGVTASRADAIRFAARDVSNRMEKKSLGRVSLGSYNRRNKTK